MKRSNPCSHSSKPLSKEENSANLSKFQRFSIEQHSRSELKGASYNPRKIDVMAKRKLRDNLRKVGLIAPIVWNRRTGNIVSGHQRLACLDALESKNDYLIDVAVVDLDEQVEREQNIFMNNDLVMGSWDLPLLEAALKDLDFDKAGFELFDLDEMFGSGIFDAVTATREAQDVVDSVRATADEIDEMKAKRKSYRRQMINENDSEFMIVLVFNDREEQIAFLKEWGFSVEEKFISGGRFAELIRGQQTSPASPEVVSEDKVEDLRESSTRVPPRKAGRKCSRMRRSR